jgi:hypothetical protein
VSPDMPFTCQDCGSLWPYVAWRLLTLAPNLAPTRFISQLGFYVLEQVSWRQQEADRRGSTAAWKLTAASGSVASQVDGQDPDYAVRS